MLKVELYIFLCTVRYLLYFSIKLLLFPKIIRDSV
jgi:hypothetical protein